MLNLYEESIAFNLRNYGNNIGEKKIPKIVLVSVLGFLAIFSSFFKRSNKCHGHTEALHVVASENQYSIYQSIKGVKDCLHFRKYYAFYNENKLSLLAVLRLLDTRILLKGIWHLLISKKSRYVGNYLNALLGIGLLSGLSAGKACFVIYNDHSPLNLLIKELYKNRVKIVYVQHASVTTIFPKLWADHSWLWSERDAEAYSVESNDVKYTLTHNPRLQGLKVCKLLRENSILLAPNEADSIIQVQATYDILSSRGYIVKIRPHPRDKYKYSRYFDECILSNSDLHDDLSTADYIVGNESGIIIEAMYIGVGLIKAAFWSENLDIYALAKNDMYNDVWYELSDVLRSNFSGNDRKKIDWPYFYGDLNKKLTTNLLCSVS